ncbi:MAG: DUF4249 domain-containing protein [Bacteroidia bacterium]|nr:DUF4249 domain-containing protein [Bacteroidota bacterium]MBP8073867.1 DUF4249 domain-containing protein [Bacteroidia bacterium]
MKRLVYSLFILTGLVALTSCENDLESDIPSAKPQLVVNSLFTLDSIIRIEVSASASPGQGGNIQSLRDAKIILFEDETQLKDLVLDSMLATPFNFSGAPNASVAPVKLYFHKVLSSPVKSGRPYTIEVKYPGMESVTATNTVPRPVRAIAESQILGSAINIDGTPMVKHSFTINDNGGRENAYGIEVIVTPAGQTGPAQRIPFFSGEKAFSENLTVTDGQYSQGVLYQPQNGVYFTNGKFQGRHKTFDFYVDEQYTSNQYDLKVRFLTLSRDFFEFATSYQKQKLNNNNPFAEPTQVYSNIENGLGIFAGFAVTEVVF